MPIIFWARVFFIFITLPSVFIFSSVRAETPSIVISEIGATASGAGEWIEIVNITDAPIDLTGWRFWEAGSNHTLTDIGGSGFIIPPHAYAVIVKNETAFREAHPSFTGILIGSSWGSLANAGEEIGLKHGTSEDAFVERFTYIAASAHSIERIRLDESDYSAANWVEHPSGDTAGQAYEGETQAPAPPPPAVPPTPVSPPSPTPTQLPQLRLSEFVSDPNTGEREWIEIENIGAETADLTTIIIRDGSSIIFTGTTTIASQTFFLIPLTSARLNNSGDRITIETTTGEVIDGVTYGSWYDGNTNDNAPTPARGKSLARIDNAWIETDPTPNTANIAATNPTPTPPSPTPPTSGTQPSPAPVATNQTPPITARAGDIIISEFVSDPTDGEVEFIELQNRTGASIDISGWRIEDGGSTKTILTGSIASMAFFVIEKPKGTLNNSGDAIIIFDKGNREIDRVSFGTWNDGNTNDNAAAPIDPMSAARVEGRDTGYDKDDFVLTPHITKGSMNRFPIEKSSADQTVIIDGLIINELYPNPPGSDEEEFIELKHTGKTQMRLQGFGLRDESLRLFSLPDVVIYPNNIILFTKKVTGISLNNTTDTVELIDPKGKVIDRVSHDHVPEGETYSRTQTNTWLWTSSITPEKENILVTKNRAPAIVIEAEEKGRKEIPHTFDASDTSDPEHDVLTFTWHFPEATTQTGQTVQHVFTKTGTTTVTLVVNDSAGNTTTSSIDIFITEENNTEEEDGEKKSTNILLSFAEHGVVLSELTPNPKGSDESEFIELYNETDEPKNISGWKIRDASGKTFTFPNDTVLNAHTYYLLQRSMSGIALNNTTDTVILQNTEEAVIETVTYTGSREGFTYAKNADGVWGWTEQATPEKENVFPNIAPPSTTKKIQTASTLGGTKGIPFSTIHTLPKGRAVTISGILLTLPGVWHSQMISVLEPTTGQTVSVYLSNKQFPEMKEGDVIRVAGVVSEAQGVKRVNIKKTSDITITGSDELTPTKTTSTDLQAHLNQFIILTGEITEITKKGFFLESNGEEEVVYRQALLAAPPTISLGDTVRVQGVVLLQNGKPALFPRQASDIVQENVNLMVTISSTEDSPIGTNRGVEPKTVATGASLMTLLAAAFGRARMVMMFGGMKRVTMTAITRMKKPKG
jgi:DNA/RNA endonuclease YhcR with UshA esterase domain